MLNWKALYVLFVALGFITTKNVHSVQTINNSATPKYHTKQIVFDELWRLTSSDPEYLLGIPADAVAAGRYVLILDKLLDVVHVFDQLGNYERQIGRPGDGPGEFRSPIHMIDFSDETFGILTYAPGYLHHYRLDGELVASHKIDTGAINTVGNRIYGANPLFVMLISDITSIRDGRNRGTSSLTKLVRYSYAGEISTVYHSKKRDLFYAGNKPPPPVEDEQYFMSGFDASKQYAYLATERNEYKIAVLDAAGDTVRVITRDYQSLQRTKTERDSIAVARSMPSGERVAVDYLASDLEQDIIELKVHMDDWLWVLTSRGAQHPPVGVYQVWDRFDEFGVFNDQVEVILDVNSGDVLFWLGGNALLVCRNLMNFERSYYAVVNGLQTDSSDEGCDLEIVYLRGRMIE